MNAITVSGLRRDFGEKAAVDGVDFEVGEGEFFVMVGPSGCGKTTTLRMIAGLEEVSDGKITMNGSVVNDERPRHRDVAMVFQDYAIFPHLTVYENIAYGMRSRRRPRAEIRQKVPDAAKTFRIDHLLKRKPRQLSGGERQRVALSRAMVRDAQLYLYDEPLSNLDAQLRHQAREDILTLHKKQGKPSIYVTHDQSEAMTMGDRIMVMRGGKVQQVGTGRELYEKPRNLFTAFFVGTPSMNLFDATLTPEDDGMFLRGPGLDIRLAPETAERLTDKPGREGRKVKLGIRPEDLHVPNRAPFEVDEHNTLKGVVDVVEPTATGSTVYVTTLEEPSSDVVATFKVRVPASYVGREIPLAVDTAKIHLFDAETELSLLTA